MKKMIALLLTLTTVLCLGACGAQPTAESTASELPTSAVVSTAPIDVTEEQQESSNTASMVSGTQTPITLTIGDTVLEAYLNDSVPAQSLLAQLPLSVTVSDSDNDFCGDSLEINYTEEDVQFGYHNGD